MKNVCILIRKWAKNEGATRKNRWRDSGRPKSNIQLNSRQTEVRQKAYSSELSRIGKPSAQGDEGRWLGILGALADSHYQIQSVAEYVR
jgi:hypothetical protein